MNFGVYATIQGMGGVFATLSLIAFLMWILGRIFSRDVSGRMKGKIKKEMHEAAFTDNEIAAVIAAVRQHESGKIPDMKVPVSWKKMGKIEGLRW